MPREPSALRPLAAVTSALELAFELRFAREYRHDEVLTRLGRVTKQLAGAVDDQGLREELRERGLTDLIE